MRNDRARAISEAQGGQLPALKVGQTEGDSIITITITTTTIAIITGELAKALEVDGC
jgi:hypothetical protein